MIDARGRSCPEPLMMLKKAMTSKEDAYDMMVDNNTALENVTRYATHNGYTVSVSSVDGEHTLKIVKG